MARTRKAAAKKTYGRDHVAGLVHDYDPFSAFGPISGPKDIEAMRAAWLVLRDECYEYIRQRKAAGRSAPDVPYAETLFGPA